MTMSSSLTAGLLAGIAFDVGFQRCLRNRDASADVGCFGGGDVGCFGCFGGGDVCCFGCHRQNGVFGGGCGVDVGGLGTLAAGDVGCFGGGLGDVGCSGGGGVGGGDVDDVGGSCPASPCPASLRPDAFDLTLCCDIVARKGTSAVNALSFAESSTTASRLSASWIWLMILCRVDLDYIGPYASLKHL